MTYKQLNILLLLFLSITLNANIIDTLTKEEKAFIKQYPTITVANEMDWPPFDYVEKGVSTGYSIDQIKLLAKKTGLKIKFINGHTWAQLVEMFKNKQIDVMPVFYKNKKREVFTLFTKPYVKSILSLYSTQNNKKLKSIDDLNKKLKIGIQKGEGSIAYIKQQYPNIQIVEIDGTKETLKALATNQVDGIIENPFIFHYFVKRYQLFNLQLVDFIESSNETLNPSMHIGIRKDLSILHSILDKAMESITTSQKDKLERRWLDSEYIKKRDKQIVLSHKEKEFLKLHNKFTVHMEDKYIPFSNINKDGKFVGYSIDYANMVASKLGIEFIYNKDETWDKAISNLKDKKIDIIAQTINTKPRQKFALFTQDYMKYHQSIVVKNKNLHLNSLENLKGYTVGVVSGYYQEKIMQQAYSNIKLKSFIDNETLLNAILLDKIDAAISTHQVIQYNINSLLLKDITSIPILNNPYLVKTTEAFAVAKNLPLLYSALKKAFNSISNDDISKLELKWFGESTKINKNKIKLLPLEEIYLRNKRDIKVCVDPNWMPFESIDEDGKYKGISKDILDLLEQRSYIKFKLVPTSSWSQTLEFAQQRKCDILPFAMKTPNREEYMDFTKPHSIFPIVVVTKNKEFFIDNIQELKGKKVSMVKGYSHTELLRQKYPFLQIVEVSNLKQGLELVQRGNVYGHLDALASVAYVIQNEGMVDIKIAGKLDENWELSIASRSDEPLLHDIFEKLLSSITVEEKQIIYNKWYAVKFEQGFNNTLLWKILMGVFVFVIFMLWRHYELKQKHIVIEKVNKKLEEAKKIAEETTKSKSEFLANMSHEIRTPMNAIIGMTHLALSSNSIKQQKEYLEDINTSSQVLSNIVDDILDFSKIEAGKLILENKEFSIINMVNSMVIILTYQAQEKDLTLVVNSDISNEDIFVGDSLRVSQILTNLVSNAIKFTSSGQISINIKKEDDKSIRFEVLDSGIGLSDEESDKLFQPFIQADGSTTRKYGGTGLGLVISKQLVELMNGTIWVESQKGIGSKFSFIVQLEQVKNPQHKKIDENKKDISTLSNEIKQLGNTNILLVEDLKVNQKIILGLLKNSSINIDIAYDGQEACNMYKENPNKYALILMDLQMPIMGGIEATKVIRELDKDIPIIALSANAMKDDIEQTKDALMNEHLKKPIDVKKLYEVLLTYIVSKTKLAEFKHINKEYALSLILNNEEIFIDILKGLLEYKDIKFEDLNKESFKETIHALKGISASAGAMTLHKIIVEIDNTQDRKLLGKFYEEFRKVIGEIEKI